MTETVALLEFDLKRGPTIVLSHGKIPIPKKIVNWAIQSIVDDTYATGFIEGLYSGAIKFTLRDPMSDERGGRRSYSYLIISHEKLQEFETMGDKVIEWAHARVDGLPQQIERLKSLLNQLVDREPILSMDRDNPSSSAIPQKKSPPATPIPSHNTASIEMKPRFPSKTTKQHPSGNTCDIVTIKSVSPHQPIDIKQPRSTLVEEPIRPFNSIIIAQWVDVTEQITILLQIGEQLNNQQIRILTLFALGCNNEQESLILPFGSFFVRRLSDNKVLIGLLESNYLIEEPSEFFDVLGDILNQFPNQAEFFLDLYRRNQSVQISYKPAFATQKEPCPTVGNNAVGLNPIIQLMDGSRSIKEIVDTLQPNYSFYDILYQFVVLQDLNLIEVR